MNPPLEISGFPESTKSLALIVEDPDAPRGVYDHWVVWNIPPNEAIGENSRPGISGKNSFGNTGYGGPCPPAGSHRYFFKVYALDRDLDIQAGSDKQALQNAMLPIDVMQSLSELWTLSERRSLWDDFSSPLPLSVPIAIGREG